MTSDFPLSAYLERVGLARRELAGLGEVELVERVVVAQLAAIPFENLEIHRGVVVDIDPAAIADLLIARRRGGICYQLNGLLLGALCALGLDAEVVGARVVGPIGLGPPLGHMAVIVRTAAGNRLVDAGFGGDHVHRRIDLAESADHRVEFGAGPGYQLESDLRELSDFVAMAWWHSTSPGSRFTNSLVCSRTDGTLRETLTDTDDPEVFRLIRNEADRRTETIVPGHAVPELLARVFGVAVEEVPRRLDHAQRHGVGNGSPR